MKFCICFFGVVGRSLSDTINSINNNIFDVLKEHNIEYDVLCHNILVDSITNLRTGEKDAKVNNDDYKLLNPTIYIEDKQEDIDKLFKYENYRADTTTDIYKIPGCPVIKNIIRQMYSIEKVTELWKSKKDYDLYIYLRPDLLYINKINVPQILENINKKNILFTPNWGQGAQGINDRIYYGDYKTIQIFGNRINSLNNFTIDKGKVYNSEKHMKILTETYEIEKIFIDLKGNRVRVNGIIVKEP